MFRHWRKLSPKAVPAVGVDEEWTFIGHAWAEHVLLTTR
jgi:hypothetical protein